MWCGENDKTRDCISNVFKCINYLSIAEKLKINLNPDHAANGLNCPCYKKQIERQNTETKFTAWKSKSYINKIVYFNCQGFLNNMMKLTIWQKIGNQMDYVCQKPMLMIV